MISSGAGEDLGVGGWKEVIGTGKKAGSEKMGLRNTYLILVVNLGLDLKNRSRVRDWVPTSHCEYAGTH